MVKVIVIVLFILVILALFNFSAISTLFASIGASTSAIFGAVSWLPDFITRAFNAVSSMSYLFMIILLYVSVFVLIKALGLFGITKERRSSHNEKDNKDD